MERVSFMPFSNESDCLRINGLTIENRYDKVSLFGSIDFTKDLEGLNNVLQLKRLIDAVAEDLKKQRATLPDKIQTNPEEYVQNPFS